MSQILCVRGRRVILLRMCLLVTILVYSKILICIEMGKSIFRQFYFSDNCYAYVPFVFCVVKGVFVSINYVLCIFITAAILLMLMN